MGDTYQITNQEATYFLTFQVVGWADIFSRQVYRDIIIDSFKFCRKEKGLELYAYVIMTNHIHAIMRSKNGQLSGLIRDFKKFTSKQIIQQVETNTKESRKEWLKMIFKYYAKFNKRTGDEQLWTHENHAIELNTNEKIYSRIKYIHANPIIAGIVQCAEDYI